MQFHRYSSRTDAGADCVFSSLKFQPENVLGLLLFPGGKNENPGLEAYYDSLTEFVDECASELGKYQCAVVFSYSGNNVFDLHATLCHYRYPKSYLKEVVEYVPDVPVYYSQNLPEGVKDVTDYHKMDDEPFKRFLFGCKVNPNYSDTCLSEEIATLIKKGVSAKMTKAK